MDKLTHWKKLHNPNYIGAWAIEPGKEPIVTIQRAGQEEVTGSSGKKEECMVVHFKEKWAKPLVCNVTNSKSIERALGTPYIEEWPNGKIQLYVTTVNAFGEEVEAIRVKPKAPNVDKPKLEPGTERWNKAIDSIVSGKVSFEKVEQLYNVDILALQEAVAEVENA